MLMNVPVIIVAVFLTLSYFFPPIPAAMLTVCGVVIATVIWLFMRQTKRTSLATPEAKRRESSTQRKVRAAAATKVGKQEKSRKQEKTRKVRKVLLVSWTFVEILFGAIVVIFMLSAWQPGWFTSMMDKIKMGFAGVAIEPGHEAEWKLTTLSGKAYLGRKMTTPLISPSQFNWQDNRLVIVAEADRGGYFKLEGDCQSWSVVKPWILACHGHWNRVASPGDAILRTTNQVAGTSDGDYGTFSVEFLSGAREGQVSLTLGEGADGVPGWLKFSLVKGK
jgi:hypothetical protein